MQTGDKSNLLRSEAELKLEQVRLRTSPWPRVDSSSDMLAVTP